MAEEYLCAVAVATIWSKPNCVRTVDQPGITNPVSISTWIENMTRQERDELCNENRIESQLLYGETVEVDEIHEEWAKIRAVQQPYRQLKSGYPGWVPVAQLVKKERGKTNGYIKVKESRTQLFDDKHNPLIVVSFNTVLPVLSQLEDTYMLDTPHGRAQIVKDAVDFANEPNGFAKKDAKTVANTMLKFLDIPYFWAGMSSYGYDCSGLTFNAMTACGYSISRDASDQARGGKEVEIDDRESWKIGDLVFFTTPEKEIVQHVGIYLGANTILHTSIKGGKVEVIKLEGHPLDDEITHIRRYIEEA